MDSMDLSWIASYMQPSIHMSSDTSCRFTRNVINEEKVAWKAPVISPKVAVFFQPRCSRAIPVWELQAPENCFNLSTLLQVLEEVDEACVLTVRKIHKIGLHSARLLREHFSQFGEVDRVMLLPSRPKSAGGNVVGKIRPASMAFVVMRSRQPAIIARLSELHEVEGCQVQVQKFKRDPTNSVDDYDYITPCMGDNYGWLDDASTVADRSPPVARTMPKMIN